MKKKEYTDSEWFFYYAIIAICIFLLAGCSLGSTAYISATDHLNSAVGIGTSKATASVHGAFPNNVPGQIIGSVVGNTAGQILYGAGSAVMIPPQLPGRALP